MPSGSTRITYEGKTRTVTRIWYDEIGLAVLDIRGFEGGLAVAQRLRADQLQSLLDSGHRVLSKMLELNAIGTDTLREQNAAGIDRLEHILNRGDL